MKSKYASFSEFLSSYNGDSLRISFKEIEKIINSKLPNTAYVHDEWWANTYYQPFMKAILKSGWKQRKIERFIEFVEFEKVYDPQIIKERKLQKRLITNS